MRLDLPHPVPLPDDVRARALGTVLAGLDDAEPRRRTVLPLVAAAVAAVLVVSISVAVGLASRPVVAPATAPPVAGPTSPDTAAVPTAPVPDAERCAAAVVEVPVGEPQHRGAQDVRVTGGFPLDGSDTVLVLDEGFVCLATPETVSVAAFVSGTAMGEATVARLGPAVVAVFNPQRREIDIAEEPGLTVLGDPDAPIRLVLLPGVELPDLDVTVAGSYDGPLPTPADPGFFGTTGNLPEREVGTRDANDLDSCLASAAPWQNSRGELFVPVLRHEPGEGRPPVLLARIGDLFAGICTLFPEGGPQFEVIALNPTTTVQTAPGGDWAVALLAVPPDTRAADVAGDPCAVGDGFVLCTGVDEGATVTVQGPDGTAEVPLPVP